MATRYHQISLKETFSDCQDMFIDDAPSFFQLLDGHSDISDFIPSVFYNAFYQSLGRKQRTYPLTGFLSALILQKVFSIPTDALLILFLNLCKELRDFCGFSKVPDAPLFTRFKQKFLPYIELMFQKMVDFTEPICQTIDSSLAQMLTFDTSGIELYVTENNPKTLDSLVRHIAFLDDDGFKAAHPEIPVEKKSDSPEEDKSVGDSSSLKPVLSDFFALHPGFHPDTFLGDSAFDSIDIYGVLKNEFHFSKARIPYHPRNESTLEKVGYNSYGYPTCPKDATLDMKYAGHCHEKDRSDRDKWVCPKVHMVNREWVCDCKEPCSTAKKGHTAYTYENMDFRMFPGVQRDSEEWRSLYKIRTIVERTINHFKTNMCVAGRMTRNHATTKADVFLAGIASQLSVIVAYRMGCPKYIRSLKPLVA